MMTHDECRETEMLSLTIFIALVSGSENLTNLSLIASFTSADHQTLGLRLIRPKGMEDLASFNVREAKRAAVEEREKNEYSFAEE